MRTKFEDSQRKNSGILFLIVMLLLCIACFKIKIAKLKFIL